MGMAKDRVRMEVDEGRLLLVDSDGLQTTVPLAQLSSAETVEKGGGYELEVVLVDGREYVVEGLTLEQVERLHTRMGASLSMRRR